MNKLDEFLKTYLPNEDKILKSCCDNKEMIISPNLIKYVCINCGTTNDNIYTVDDIEKFKGNYVKTFIGYSANSKLRRKIYRLQKWTNYDRLDIKMNEYLEYISNLPIDDELVITFTRIKFKELLPKMNIRGNNRKALICYCLYNSYLYYKKDVDIDELMVMLEINYKNYNDTNKKIPYNRIFYIEKINYYLGLIDNKINKNYLISIYNLFYNISDEFNKKTLVIGLIYHILEEKEIGKLSKDKMRINFLELFKISDSSLYVITFHINQNKNIIYKYIINE